MGRDDAQRFSVCSKIINHDKGFRGTASYHFTTGVSKIRAGGVFSGVKDKINITATYNLLFNGSLMVDEGMRFVSIK